jgi:hypothetical protein
MKPPRDAEKLNGHHGATITFEENSMTSFTEIKLSLAQKHAEKYGLLGIGVDRKFVLDRMGLPVQYVRNSENESFVNNVFVVEEFLRKIRDLKLDDDAKLRLENFTLNCGFLKAMSLDENENFELLEEHEWRIIHLKRMENDKIVKTDRGMPPFLIPLRKNDVKVIIFPDYATKKMATGNEKFQEWMNDENTLPIMLTLEECNNF